MIEGISGKLGETSASAEAKKMVDAARQFEALLLTQILRSGRAADEIWSDPDQMQHTDSVMGMAEEQIAQALAARGALGIASLVVQGLAADKATAAAQSAGKASAPSSPADISASPHRQ
jgi:Rod binding domain-containing protein